MHFEIRIQIVECVQWIRVECVLGAVLSTDALVMDGAAHHNRISGCRGELWTHCIDIAGQDNGHRNR